MVIHFQILNLSHTEIFESTKDYSFDIILEIRFNSREH